MTMTITTIIIIIIRVIYLGLKLSSMLFKMPFPDGVPSCNNNGNNCQTAHTT